MAELPLLRLVGADELVPLVGGGEIRYANLDYAASTPALESVADAVAAALPLYASVNRGTGYPSQVSTEAYEGARESVAHFVGARSDNVVLFTRNTTDSLNLLASVVPGEAVVLDIEHHANLLPWLARGARVISAGTSIEGLLADLDRELVSRPAALVAVTGASNVTGERLPLARLAELAHRRGSRLAVDGAQLVPHRRVDLSADGVDYLAFSGHKLYAPFGAGALVGRGDWLDTGKPYLLGGGAVANVTIERTDWHSGAARHEAGSPNVLGAVAISAAIGELSALDESRWLAHEHELREQLDRGLSSIAGVRIHRIFDDSTDPVGVVSFSIDGISSRRAAVALSAEYGIGVRDGRFCAHPLLARFGGPALRASVGIGSSSSDIERLVAAVAELAAQPKRPRYNLVEGRWRVQPV